ncbi:MAG TPA: hypothetical protein ENK57_18385 [Polyangiaceae bacterium]|nr:hypothetical protein [Polyangiaceae bacterium]
MSDQEPIGQASMDQDGTIVLDLYPQGPGGLTGIAQLRIPPGDSRYQDTLDHLGGLNPGEKKLCPPWPEQPSEGEGS